MAINRSVWPQSAARAQHDRTAILLTDLFLYRIRIVLYKRWGWTTGETWIKDLDVIEMWQVGHCQYGSIWWRGRGSMYTISPAKCASNPTAFVVLSLSAPKQCDSACAIVLGQTGFVSSLAICVLGMTCASFYLAWSTYANLLTPPPTPPHMSVKAKAHWWTDREMG